MGILKSIVRSFGPRVSGPMGYVCYGLAAVALAAALWGVAALLTSPLQEPLVVGGVAALLTIGAGAVTLLTKLGDLFGQHVRDVRAAQVYETLRRGEEPPPYTLYLRPFASTGAFEDVGLGAPTTGGAGAIGGLIGTTVELEAQIEQAVRPLGHLIALGIPLEHIGAGRILAAENEWKDAVHLLMSKARLIIMLPSSRQGTLEEIDMILDSDLITRTVLIDPPNISRKRKFDHQSEWEGVQRAFAQRGYDIPEETRLGRLLFYGQNRAPQFKEWLDIDADDRIERLFRRVIRDINARTSSDQGAHA